MTWKKQPYDTLNRRNREVPTSTGVNIRLNKNDIEAMWFIHTHGYLTSEYVCAWVPKLGKYRLGELTHEKNVFFDGKNLEGPVLYRPKQQWNGRLTHNGRAIYALTKVGQKVLQQAGRWSDHAPHPDGSFWHQVMVPALTASIHLKCRELGYTYYSQAFILERAGKKLEIGTLRPDALFALGMNNKILTCFLEADKGTEQLSLSSLRKTWEGTIPQYKFLFDDDYYKSFFNLESRAILLNVTISDARKKRMIDMLAPLYPNGCNYIFTTSMDGFASPCDPPPILDMFNVVWERYNYPQMTLAEFAT